MINVIFNQFDYEISAKKQERFDKYNKVIQWGRRNPVKFMELFFNLEFTDHQKYILLSTWYTERATWLMSRNSGKSSSLNTPIYCPTSDRGDKYIKKTIGDLKVGDQIYDDTGNLTEVIHLNPIVIEDVYEVEFDDGEVVECNMEHLWSVYDRNFNQRRIEKVQCLRNTGFLYDNFKLVNSKNGKVEYRFHVPVTKPINYPNIQNLPIPSYLLGYWLGDGCINSSTVVVCEEDLLSLCMNLDQIGCVYDYKPRYDRPHLYDVSVDTVKSLRENNSELSFTEAKQLSFKDKLRQLGILSHKRIPERYLYGTIEQRLELLQGIMDTDGYCDKGGHCEISQSADHLDLLQDISKLLDSLGIKNKIHYKKSSCNGKEYDAYRINFRTDKTMPCFKLKRKYDRLPEKSSQIVKQKAIVDVRKTGKKKAMRCITVSNDSGLFLCGDKFTVTHNSYLSSPYIMARSILIPNHKTYILCPAGNQAQETFGKMEDLAKDNIASVSGATSVFWDELIRANGTSDGFVHDKTSHHCELYNGAEVSTVNSVPKNIVGIRLKKKVRFKTKSLLYLCFIIDIKKVLK